MLTILNQYIDGDMIITEYTKDGETVHATVKTPNQEETGGQIIELPKNPIIEVKDKIVLLEGQNSELNLQIIGLWEVLIDAEVI